MRDEHSHPYNGENRNTNDDAAQRRRSPWRPGDTDRRAEGRWREDGQGNWRRFQWGGTDGRGGQADSSRTPHPQEFQEAREPGGNPYGGPSGYSSPMDWDRSGSVRQDYGDYGHAMDDRRQAQEDKGRQPPNQPNPRGGRPHGQAPARNGRPPKGYTRSDERIREDVCEQLMADHYIDAGDVSVEVKAGVVTLSGSVRERNMRYALESVAASCLGVTDVENHVKVGDGRDTRSTGNTRDTNGSHDTGEPHKSNPQHDGEHGSEAARAYAAAQNYARDNGKPDAASPSSSSEGLTNTSVSDTRGLGGDQSRFIRHHTD